MSEADRETRRLVRDGLREVAVPVLAQSRLNLSRLNPTPSKTVEGLRIYVRKAGTISVEQRLPKTTRLRADWGATQMRRGLIPAAEEAEPRMQHIVEEKVRRITETLNGG